MCVLALAYTPALPGTPEASARSSASGPLLHLISNRDEFLQRPTAPLHWWDDSPVAGAGWILGGRDLRAGGSWLAINRAGRLAVLTNHRQGAVSVDGMRSRGELVAAWLDHRQASLPPQALATRMAQQASQFAGFSLLLFDFAVTPGEAAAWLVCNRSTQALAPLSPGIHALSNDVLNSPWPKSEHLKATLATLDGAARPGDQPGPGVTEEAAVLAALRNEQQAADGDLPATGVSLERERYLSAVFIRPPDLSDPLAYGTRSSTVLKVFAGHAEMSEHTWYPQPQVRRFLFRFSRAH